MDNQYDIFESEEERKEVARYGLYQAGIILGGVLVIFILAAIMGIIMETVSFFIVLFFLRVNAGGYHAKTVGRCIVLSSIFTFICLCVLKWVAIPILVREIIVGILGLFLWKVSPIDCPNKPLEDYEKKRYRKRCRLLISIFWGCFIVCLMGRYNALSAGISVAFIFSSFLVCLGMTDQFMTKRKLETMMGNGMKNENTDMR